MIIEGGTGDAYAVKVDADHLLHTRAVRTHEDLFSSLKGQGFNLPYGTFTLTTATASALAYFYWADTSKYAVLGRQVFSFGPSTGGTGLVRLRIVRNPTGGTIISGGTGVTAINNNFGSGTVPNGTFKKGDQGSTVTGGSTIIDLGVPTNYFFNIGDVNWVITNGSSYALEITPPSGNTSMTVYVLDKFRTIDPDAVL